MDYAASLEALRLGQMTELVIEAQDFPAFFNVWRDYPYQNAIVGQAGRGGVVTYRAAKEQEV